MRNTLLVGLIPLVAAVPAPAPVAEPTVFNAAVVGRAPEPTPTADVVRRGIFDDASSFIDSLGSDVASGFSSFVDSGILDFPNGFPTGSAVESSLGIKSDDTDAQPTQVLNVP